MSKNILVMPFVDESESFTNGWECGEIWAEMERGTSFDKKLIHTVNIKQINLMCEHFGYSHIIKEYDDTWAYLTASPIDISSLTK